MSDVRVAFVSPSGLGNLGDAAIIESLIAGVRRRHPAAEIVGFTLNPSDTEARHGVEAHTCGAFSLRHYGMRPVRAAAGDGDAAAAPRAPSPLRRVVAALPGARPAKRLASMALAEGRHRRAVAERIRGFDYVAVAGGGQLDELWGGPFGHPYTLYRWSEAARDAGARFVVLSVGTGTLATRLGRGFVGRALASASYRSYRDARSRELVGKPALTAEDPIVPDLAYALPVTADAPPRTRTTVGLAPMCYADPRVWPVPDAARYRRHVETFADVGVRVLAAGHDVALFGTDRPDREAVTEARAAIAARVPADQLARVRVVERTSVADLMQLYASLDVVIAARFHGVLLAHVAGRPVIAVSHERKVTTLMHELGQDRLASPIDEFDPATAFARVGELLADGSVVTQIRERSAENRRRVEDQFDRVFGGRR